MRKIIAFLTIVVAAGDMHSGAYGATVDSRGLVCGDGREAECRILAGRPVAGFGHGLCRRSKRQNAGPRPAGGRRHPLSQRGLGLPRSARPTGPH